MSANQPFNPDAFDTDVDEFSSSDADLQAHLNRLVGRVNFLARQLNNANGLPQGGTVRTIGINSKGQPLLLDVIAVGNPRSVSTALDFSTLSYA